MTPRTEAIARYNAQYGLPPDACNCHHGSARMCPAHTQADYDAAKRVTEGRFTTAEPIARALDAAGYVIVPKDRLAALERVREAAAVMLRHHDDLVSVPSGAPLDCAEASALRAALSDGGES